MVQSLHVCSFVGQRLGLCLILRLFSIFLHSWRYDIYARKSIYLPKPNLALPKRLRKGVGE